MAGNSASSNIEGFIYVAMNSIYNTALTFTGQNIGAKQYPRVKRIFAICVSLVSAIGIGLGLFAWRFGETLLDIYAPGNAEVIAFGMVRLGIISLTYFLCGIIGVMVGMLRGIGTSLTPMIVSLIGVCGIRITWIYSVFARHRELKTLYISYPISWLVTASIHLVCYFIYIKRLERGGRQKESDMVNKLLKTPDSQTF